jgi:hypothetical protein
MKHRNRGCRRTSGAFDPGQFLTRRAVQVSGQPRPLRRDARLKD